MIQETEIVPFQVNDKPFKFLSDHFGIESILKYTSDLHKTGQDVEHPEKREFSVWKLQLRIIFLAISAHIELYYGYRLSTILVLLILTLVTFIFYDISYATEGEDFTLPPIHVFKIKGHRRTHSRGTETHVHKAVGPINPFEDISTLYTGFQ